MNSLLIPCFSCSTNASRHSLPIDIGNESLVQVMEEMSNSSLLSLAPLSAPSGAPSAGGDCERYRYEPAGYQYTVLIGPAFFLFFTATGIPLGILADFYSRKVSRWQTQLECPSAAGRGGGREGALML